jgi:hypothetical protein
MENKIDILNKRLKEVVDKFNELKSCGIDMEILTIYLERKTKLSKANIEKMLFHLDEFYNKLIKNAVLEELE